MTFMILSMHNEESPLYFWGEDSLEMATATIYFEDLFKLKTKSGSVPWPVFIDTECTIIAIHKYLNSPADVKSLYPELFI